MQVLYLFVIAILNSIDNIGVGVAYSVAGVKVKLAKNLLIASLAFLVSFLASLFGQFISYFLNDTECSIISMLLLVIMGIRMIYTSFSDKNNIEANKNNVKELGFKEAFSIGIALALDDISSSVSSALVGYSAFMVSLPYFIISLGIFFSGNYALKFITKLNVGKKPTILAGILMIIIGLSQIFD
ncbi:MULTISPECIES: manganese efflux pump [unclassified Clostridium]|uniref:manganese efflux pump n=1 Tax=unclassified Clostridium TaxID=2614128 RepID=UPI000297F0EF|nr:MULTISPECIES: manganese efflux pump [unclassified Clostridium]EKQ50144.1 MAG: putative membrane protein [Clostridium sp. Maddingley MBC34-26]